MIMTLVFSFLTNSWRDLSEVQAMSEAYLGNSHALQSAWLEESAVLCTLEKSKQLLYDGRWHKTEAMPVPEDCQPEAEFVRALPQLQVRSASLNPNSEMSAWDHKVEVQNDHGRSFSIYLRQDKNYVGAHSDEGWSMWIERRSGSIRYEMVNREAKTHFRMFVAGKMNPLKGGMSDVSQLEALYVESSDKNARKAVTISGNQKKGFRRLAFAKSETKWSKIEEICSKKEGCKAIPPMLVSESQATKFGDTKLPAWNDFLSSGRPLAFNSIRFEETLPLTGIFR